MSKIVSILGSTGSIGTQSLKVCEKLGYRLYALTAHANWQLMEQQIRQFHPAVAVMTDPQAAQKLQQAVEDCVEMEQAVKSGKLGDRLAVEMLIIRYSGGE